MDVLEHLNPFNLPDYIRKISTLVSRSGFVVINSPMYGTDDIFGTPFPPYLREWQKVGNDGFWRHMHCDPQGWPLHGHLVWASPQWWEQTFLDHGLTRDREAERAIQHVLTPFFESAPARKCLFVLRPTSGGTPLAPVAESLRTTLEAVEGLPTAAPIPVPLL